MLEGIVAAQQPDVRCGSDTGYRGVAAVQDRAFTRPVAAAQPQRPLDVGRVGGLREHRRQFRRARDGPTIAAGAGCPTTAPPTRRRAQRVPRIRFRRSRRP